MLNILATAANGAKNGLTVETAQTLTQNTIYLMGFSFIIGSLFTIFVLIVLDFMRRNKEGK